MKKLAKIILVGTTLLAVGGCSKNNSPKNETNQSTKESVVATDENKGEKGMVFVGTINGAVTVNEKDKVVDVMLQNTEAISDPEGIQKNFQESGVVLHVPLESIEGGWKEDKWAIGNKVEVTLQEQAIMTHSIPPQIPGNSIKSVKVLL